MQKIELNSIILNEFVFYGIEELSLYGDIVSIEKGLFKSFVNLNAIELDILTARKLFHSGIDWVFDLNEDVNVDINNNSSFNDSYWCIILNINSISNDKRTISNLDFTINDYFPNEDFCLYAQFPFQRLILVNFIGFEFKGKDYSCTYLWFYQHLLLYNKFYNWEYMFLTKKARIPKVDKKTIDKCNFIQR